MQHKIHLVVDKKGSSLTVSNDQLIWRIDGQKRDSIPLKYLGSVVLIGSIMVDSNALAKLSDANISTMFLAQNRMGQGACLSQGFYEAPKFRIQQYCSYSNEAISINMAKFVVFQKIQAYRYLNANLAKKLSDEVFALASTSVTAAKDHSVLLGFEGSMSKQWFKHFALLAGKKWNMTNRNRRPPKDPANAVLSLSYALALPVMRQAFVASGFDLTLGFLHKPYPGRESLVLDGLEFLRAGCDRFALQQLETLEIDEFYQDKNAGVYLKKEARTRFYRAWYQYCSNWFDQNNKQGLPLSQFCLKVARSFAAQF